LSPFGSTGSSVGDYTLSSSAADPDGSDFFHRGLESEEVVSGRGGFGVKGGDAKAARWDKVRAKSSNTSDEADRSKRINAPRKEDSGAVLEALQSGNSTSMTDDHADGVADNDNIASMTSRKHVEKPDHEVSAVVPQVDTAPGKSHGAANRVQASENITPIRQASAKRPTMERPFPAHAFTANSDVTTEMSWVAAAFEKAALHAPALENKPVITGASATPATRAPYNPSKLFSGLRFWVDLARSGRKDLIMRIKVSYPLWYR